MNAIKETDARIVTTANPGCWMQMKQGSEILNSTLKVNYVTDLLDQSYEDRSKISNDSLWEEERLELRSQWKNRGSDRRKRRNR